MGIASGTALLAILALAPVAPNAAEQKYNDDLAKEIQASNACIISAVDRRIGGGKIEITDADRARIRVESADECYDHAVRLASFTSAASRGAKSLEETKVEMLSVSVAIADAMISIRIKHNIEQAQRPSQ